jgi:S1-C subfamily serine protease
MMPGCTLPAAPATERRSFVKIYRVLHPEVCKKKTQKCVPNKKGLTWTSQGSASIIETNSLGAFLLTAAHVCDTAEDLTEVVLKMMRPEILGENNRKKYLRPSIKYKIITSSGQIAYADIVNHDLEVDLCILFAEGVREKPLRRFHGSLTKGQRVYNIASPADLGALDVIPMFEGFYIGQNSKHSSVYSIPAMGGSSGSPILDANGRLIGMVHSVARAFHHVSFSPDVASLNYFIDSSIGEYRDKWHRNMLKLTRP